MNKRKITNPLNVKFEPFDNYGAPIPGMSWHKISYNKETGQGSYILKMEPGAKSLPHKHINYEEFLVLDGELIDPDNTIFKCNKCIVGYFYRSLFSSFNANVKIFCIFPFYKPSFCNIFCHNF